MKSFWSRRIAMVLVACALLPAQHVLAQKARTTQTATPPNAVPAYQADALRESADNLYNRKLTPSAEALRNDMMLLRDSLDAVAAYAERVTRAASTKTESVMLSGAKELTLACGASSRTLTLVRPRMDAIHLSVSDHDLQLRSESILKDYRTSLQTLQGVMSNCITSFPVLLKAKTPDDVQFGKQSSAIGAAVLNYEARLRIVLTQFDIPLRPK